MKTVYLSLIFAVMAVLCVPASAEQPPEELFRAITKIRASIPEHARTAPLLGTERQGSGAVIDSRGHVLTIGYLILEAEAIQVIGPNEKEISATFVAYDQDTGFGLLRMTEPVMVTPLKLGQSSDIREGDPLLVASHGGPESVQGVRVVSRQEFAGYWEYLLEDAIFTSPAYPHYGGAALIDRNGRLVGIGSLFTQIVSPGIGPVPCNMFVPIDRLKPILNDLTKSGRSAEPRKPWLGLFAEETHGRVFVTGVASDGPAEKAGLQPGDMVLKVNRLEVKGLSDFYRKVWALGGPGIKVPLTVLQGAQIREVIIHAADIYQYLHIHPKKREKKLRTENNPYRLVKRSLPG